MKLMSFANWQRFLDHSTYTIIAVTKNMFMSRTTLKNFDDRASQITCVYMLPLTKIVHKVSLDEEIMRVVFVHTMIAVHLIIPFLPECMIYIFHYKRSS